MNAKILAVLAFIAVASATSGAFEDFEKKFDSEVHEKFEQWRVAFGREYEDFEYEFRKSVFAANLKKIEMLNKMDSGATYELNEFSDLTEQEFRQTRLGTRVNPKDVRGPKAESLFVRDLPTSFDWRQKGAVTPVKNQGQCGSCWAFSTTGNVEGQHFLKTGKLVSLSEQQLVDCDHNGDHGCEGGLPSNAFEYIAQNGGVDTESSYPYIGIDSKCKFEKSSVAATVANWTALSEDEDQMAAWLVKNGPISVGINAGNLQFYSKGISNPLFCSPSGIDHGVLIVGFGVGKSLFGKTEPYWIVKNSWGESWGEKGYFRLIRGKGKCGINKMATSAIV